MKRLLAAIALSLAMTGCGTEELREVRVIVTTEEQYVSNLQERSDVFDNADEDKLVTAGKGVCKYFDNNGANYASIMILMDEMTTGFTLEDSAMVIAESVNSFCPEKIDDINSALLDDRSA